MLNHSTNLFGKSTLSNLAVLGDISIVGSIIKVDELANVLQVCLDSGAKKVLVPILSAGNLGAVPPELMGSFSIIFYTSAEDAVFKALGGGVRVTYGYAYHASVKGMI